MNEEINKLRKAKIILEKMANGVNPINGDPIEETSFLQDPRMKRCMLYVSSKLDREIDNEIDRISRNLQEFTITGEQKSRVALPEGKITISEFVRCINGVIDRTRSRKLIPHQLNSQLKALGILDEEKDEKGRTRTVLNEKSKNYGIESEKRISRDGTEYDAILFNDVGKKFLLKNLEKIVAFKRP